MPRILALVPQLHCGTQLNAQLYCAPPVSDVALVLMGNVASAVITICNAIAEDKCVSQSNCETRIWSISLVPRVGVGAHTLCVLCALCGKKVTATP